MSRDTENGRAYESADIGALPYLHYKGMGAETEVLPAVALRGLSILPGMVIHFDLSREKSIEAVERAMLGDQRLFAVTQKDAEVEDPECGDVYEIGTISVIRQVTKLPGHVLRVLAEGKSRGRLHRFVQENDYLMAEVSYENDDMTELTEAEQEAMTRTVKETFASYYTCFPKVGKAVADQIEEEMPLGRLLDSITINMPLPLTDKQAVLDAVSVRERFRILTDLLVREVDVMRIKNELAKDIRERIDKNQRDYILREQLYYIKEELGEKNTDSDVEQFEAAVEKLTAAGAKRCVPLKVSGPFHSPMLAGAGEKLAAELEHVTIGEIRIPYIANVTADYVTDRAEVKPLLEKQVSSSVRWQQTVERMIADGVDTFVEIGPGKTLSGFMRKISRDVKVVNVEKVEDLEKLQELMA